MTRRAENAAWCLAFVLAGLLGVGLAHLVGRQTSGPDLWCNGEGAHQVSSQQRPAWMTTRYRLDLRPTGVSHMRLVAQLIDADSGAELGTIRRNSAFRVQQQGHRLQLNVESSARGEADSTAPELSGTLGMFIFRSDGSLSYWMRPLSATRYLFDDGNDMFVLCSKR